MKGCKEKCNMKNVLVIPWAYEEWNLVQFFQEYMLASLYMLICQFGHIRFIVVVVTGWGEAL